MQIKDYDNPAELRLIEACRKGDDAIISWARPEAGRADNTIRAGLIRALLLGTDDCTPPARGLWIEGAWITGNLYLAGEALKAPLVLIRCTLEEDVLLMDCTLPGLYMPGTHLPKLNAHRLQCNGPLHLREGFQATGLVDLGSPTITGQLSCAGGKFLAQNMALNCEAITVGADVFLGSEFEAQGQVNLSGAKIDGTLDCDSGQFLAEVEALNCNAVTVGADVFLREGFAAKGEVNMVCAKIGRQLACDGGKFLAKGIALTCDAISVGTDVFLRGKIETKGTGFEALGAVNLRGAKIGGQFFCAGGKFLAERMALNCDAITVGADVFLRGEFEARGRINLIRAEINGNLELSSATLTKGLDAQGIRVRAQFVWADIEGDGIAVVLIDAKVGTLCDTPGSWQSVKKLRRSSFRYERIESDMDVQERLDWLAKHDATVSRFTPQPCVQLANILRRQGFAGDAARVLMRREDKQRAEEWDRAITAMDGTLRRELTAYAHQYRPLLSLPFKWMFGYGHQPAWVLLWIAAILGITIWFAQQIHIHGQFAQTTSGRDYTSFSAFLYALDLFIPLDALGQEKNWAPSAERGWWGDWGHQLRWLVQMAGWVITAIGAAVLTGLIGRRD